MGTGVGVPPLDGRAAEGTALVDRVHRTVAGLVVGGEEEAATPVGGQEAGFTEERDARTGEREVAAPVIDGETSEGELGLRHAVHPAAHRGPGTAVADVEGGAGRMDSHGRRAVWGRDIAEVAEAAAVTIHGIPGDAVVVLQRDVQLRGHGIGPAGSIGRTAPSWTGKPSSHWRSW
jgi:hypothetical protein